MTDVCSLARCEQSLFPLKIRREERETSKHLSVTLSVKCERRSFARHAQINIRVSNFRVWFKHITPVKRLKLQLNFNVDGV